MQPDRLGGKPRRMARAENGFPARGGSRECDVLWGCGAKPSACVWMSKGGEEVETMSLESSLPKVWLLE